VIRICYEDFSAGTRDLAGLHGRAERGARGVTVYLLPGLTTWQRRAVIRRLRQEASRGFGPPLPQPQLAIALGLDRVRTAARTAAAIVRLHPAATLVPGAFAMVVMTLFVAVSADGLGVASRAQNGLAEMAAVGGSTVRAAAPRPGRTRVPQVTVAVGADSSGSGGMSDSGGAGPGSGAGQSAPAKARQACPGQGAPATRSHRKRHAVRKSARPVASSACQQRTAAPEPRSAALVPTAPVPRSTASPSTAPVPRSAPLVRAASPSATPAPSAVPAPLATPVPPTTPAPPATTPASGAPVPQSTTPASPWCARQLACRRPRSRPAPYTAHRPGPRDFAR
jgi:hypothetical protein